MTAPWGNTDVAANSPLWATNYARVHPTSSNQSALYNNTTVNAYTNGQYVGTWSIAANNVKNFPDVTHGGWILRRVGTGGRAGRITSETLVCMNMSTNATGEGFIYITSQPANTDVANNAGTSFTVVAKSVPAADTITYQWQIANSTNGFNNLAANANYTGVTSATLNIANASAVANTLASHGAIFRCVLSSTFGPSINSANCESNTA